MATNNSLSTWTSIIDRLLAALPESADRDEVAAIRDRIARNGSENEQAGLEADLHSFALRHVDLLTACVEEVMAEIFQLIDPETARLRRVRDTAGLSESDRATGVKNIATLEECHRILEQVLQTHAHTTPTP